MQLYFIRHGQSANNQLYELTGSDRGRSHDPELTVTGRQQARLLGDFLCLSLENSIGDDRDFQNRRGFGLTHLYCSFMLRAVATGAYLAEALNLPLVAWKDWHENGGIYLDNEITGEPEGLPGNNRTFFEAHYPGLLLPDWLDDKGWWNRPYEVYEERLPRARRVLAELLQRHGGTDHHVAVVSHGGFYNDFLAALNGLDREPRAWFTMNNTAISRVDFIDQRVDVVYSDRMDFLPAELIT
jgi:2,3-bisphosphoglycerate-dependent phosphoglycerate mutase